MAKLEDLEKELYSPSEDRHIASRMKRRVIFPEISDKKRLPLWGADARAAPKKNFFRPRKMIPFFIAGITLFFILGGALFVFFYISTRGQEARVEIHARETVESGEVITIPVSFKNTSGSQLEGAEFTLVLPEGTLIYEGVESHPAPLRITQKIGSISPGEERTLEFKTRIFGREGEEKQIEAVLMYQPARINARFSSRNAQKITISRVPLALSWSIPNTVARNQEVEITLHYASSAELAFSDLSVRLEYPPGFLFISADPKPDVGDAIWQIGMLDPASEGKITVRGEITGEEGEIKPFRSFLGVFDASTKEWTSYLETSSDTKIAVAPLFVEGSINESRDTRIIPGERMRGVIRYKNNTDARMKNVFVRAILQDFPKGSTAPFSAPGQGFLNFKELSIENGGVFDGSARAIVWGPSGTDALKEIAPGQEGELTFSISTKERPPVRNANDKN
ncbi:MAG: hypothetical protein G01um101433_1073 [Parcubacteria group bacterium Gr01-1014_33]|nr:MAG: hypothetical protein G01um101433_1073 [Parcubacteria group bacterium Gr01-1014_33]